MQGGSNECHLRVVALRDEDPLRSAGHGVELFFGEHLEIPLVCEKRQSVSVVGKTKYAGRKNISCHSCHAVRLVVISRT